MDHYYLINEDGRWILKDDASGSPVAEFTTKAEGLLHTGQMLREK